MPRIRFDSRRSDRDIRRSQGLTLLEVMFAIAILGTGMLAMLAMQTAAMKQGRRGKEHTEGAVIAQTQMELIQNLPFTAPGAALTGWTVPANQLGTTTGGGGGGAQVAQTYAVQWRITGTPDPSMRLVDVRVTWVDPNMPIGAPPKRYAVSSAKYNDP